MKSPSFLALLCQTSLGRSWWHKEVKKSQDLPVAETKAAELCAVPSRMGTGRLCPLTRDVSLGNTRYGGIYLVFKGTKPDWGKL